jgi:hypothetical protein
MAEFIFKKSDYTHADAEKDRRGVHKKTDVINFKPDGWSAHPRWAESSYPKDFVVVKVPGMTLEESDYRGSWKDDFDYEVVATRPTQGEFDIRIFEKNAGAINQNSIAGVKASKIRDYLQAWGCSAFSMTATDASFTFSLWDAVRSQNFWNVPLIGTRIVFTLDSYTPATGIAQISLAPIVAGWTEFESLPQAEKEVKITERIVRQVAEMGGTMISIPSLIFEIERSDILTRFRADVKRRIEQVYLRHQYAISQIDHDAIMAAGGIVTMTKAEFLGKLIDKKA